MAKKRALPKTFHQQLLESDDFAQYSLRSTFFVRRLSVFNLWNAIEQVQRLVTVAENFDWTDTVPIGIEPGAWSQLEARGTPPLLYFCHPRLLAEQPRLLLYYRTIAMISQKGLDSLVSGSSARLESGKAATISEDLALRLSIALNSVLSAMLKATADIEQHHFPGLQFACLGATIQGSWNNAIGTEGETAIKTVLINHLRDEIRQIVWRDDRTRDYDHSWHAELLSRIADVKIVRMAGGFHLVFASEPDVSLRNKKDIPLVAIEVKAGADPAGALERLGAAMKSFEHDKTLNPRVKTVYVVRCLTPELQKRVSQGSPFDHTFSLAEILADSKTQQVFANLLLRVMLGK